MSTADKVYLGTLVLIIIYGVFDYWLWKRKMKRKWKAACERFDN